MARAENYQAAFDVLFVTRRLQASWSGVSHAEVHLVLYVACLLSLYRGLPASDWTYGFIRSRRGAPFSREIDVACRSLTSGGLLLSGGGVLSTTDRGAALLAVLTGGVEHSWRIPFLDGACASALAMAAGALRSALHEEPSLRRSSIHPEPRPLLSPGDGDELYEQFDAVTTAVGSQVTDLMVPSVVWLTYLAETKSANEEEAAAQQDAVAAQE